MNLNLLLNRYIGIKYVSKGTDFNGVDCYGLCKLFYKNEFQKDLPDYSEHYQDAENSNEATATVNYGIKEWKEVDKDEPELGDIIVFKILGLPTHVGIYLTDNEFLHCLPGRNSVIETLKSVTWNKRVQGIYRYE